MNTVQDTLDWVKGVWEAVKQVKKEQREQAKKNVKLFRVCLEQGYPGVRVEE